MSHVEQQIAMVTMKKAKMSQCVQFAYHVSALSVMFLIMRDLLVVNSKHQKVRARWLSL